MCVFESGVNLHSQKERGKKSVKFTNMGRMCNMDLWCFSNCVAPCNIEYLGTGSGEAGQKMQT